MFKQTIGPKLEQRQTRNIPQSPPQNSGDKLMLGFISQFSSVLMSQWQGIQNHIVAQTHPDKLTLNQIASDTIFKKPVQIAATLVHGAGGAIESLYNKSTSFPQELSELYCVLICLSLLTNNVSEFENLKCEAEFRNDIREMHAAQAMLINLIPVIEQRMTNPSQEIALKFPNEIARDSFEQSFTRVLKSLEEFPSRAPGDADQPLDNEQQTLIQILPKLDQLIDDMEAILVSCRELLQKRTITPYPQLLLNLDSEIATIIPVYCAANSCLNFLKEIKILSPTENRDRYDDVCYRTYVLGIAKTEIARIVEGLKV